MYGKGIWAIKEIDIWKNQLRIKVVNAGDKSEQWIFMPPSDAQDLVNEIWSKVEDYQYDQHQQRLNMIRR